MREMLKKIFLFEMLWKLLILGLVNPLFREIYQTYVASVGVSFNQNMIGTFLNAKGGLLFLLLFFGAALLNFYEYSVIINTIALCRQGERFTLPHVMKSSLWNLGVMRGWSLAAGALYFVLLLPLMRIGYVSTMVSHVVIPEFIFAEMRKTRLGVAGMVLIYLAECTVHLAFLFVPVCMVLRHQRFREAARESLRCWKRLSWKYRFGILGGLVLWERIITEIARYWRRKPLGNDDFGEYFFKNLFQTEAFRVDLLYWLLVNLLVTAAMAGMIWLILSGLGEGGEFCAVLCPPWSKDSAALLEMAERRWKGWTDRLRAHRGRWKLGAAAACILLAVWLVLTSCQPPAIHAPLAIGHRGCLLGVENTLPAVLAAQEAGIDYAEIDVQLTRDGVPVLFHDGNLQRLAGRSGSVAELDYEELRTIPLSDYVHPEADARIATLEEVLEVLQGGSMGLLIELKPADRNGEALASAVMELVDRYDFGERAMFMSLDYGCLLPLLELRPEWWTGYCLFSVAGDIDESVWRYNVDFLAVEEVLITSRFVTQAREQDLPVYAWSVYDDERMRQYLEMGVSGLISDYPDEVVRRVDEYRKSHSGTEYRGR